MATIIFPKLSLKESLNRAPGAPAFELGFEAFQDKMVAFTEAIDAYVLREKEAISQSAAHHTSAVRNLHTDKEDTEARIEEARAREREMLENIEAERHHLTGLTASVGRLHSQLNKLREQGSTLDGELSGVRREVGIERATKERQVQILGDMGGADETQLAVLEGALGLKIAGVADGRLLFTFTLIDSTKPYREFCFVLDVKDEYVVPLCDPPIATGELVAQLNADGDLGAFVRRVRAAFVAHAAR
ncbi:hypothetical protein CspHIS471_0302420 [Cutaneotrichosporon sp. HIS471]|nr:hypothetical protein CspHIS471_0302420 [Cutaneotrichosporon sp. HIS471]